MSSLTLSDDATPFELVMLNNLNVMVSWRSSLVHVVNCEVILTPFSLYKTSGEPTAVVSFFDPMKSVKSKLKIQKKQYVT